MSSATKPATPSCIAITTGKFAPSGGICSGWSWGGILFITIIGIPLAWLVWFVAPIWKAYRLIKGFLDLDANKPMPL